ncbi:coiled-coil domain containing 92B [Protobothrops mucrosquamatus]|uniref:coiled-coil domain containing 92B n=1 Tax=Protobothrops mucrosquamatus TaxID=103944 RepID=UPI0010FB7CBE|nr:coiled-coil domain containing 92B [Protobothrops mucrosquamatus]
METLSLEHQIQSVQRHITFLKKEQMKLLHDLHLEILRLQKYCTELTHDLEVKELEAKQQDVIDQELEEKCKIMEAQLKEKEKGNLELHKELRHKESLVAALRSNLRNKERRFLEELKRRSHRVTVLNTELQKQTEAAAYLSFQLHSTKQKLHGPRQKSAAQPEKPPEKPSVSQPSAETRPKKRTQKSHTRRQASSAFHCKGAFKDIVARERLGSFEDLEPMPDPALFLYTTRPHPPSRRQKPERSTSDSSSKEGPEQGNRKSGWKKSFQPLAEEPAAAVSHVRTLGHRRAPSSKGEPQKQKSTSAHPAKD